MKKERIDWVLVSRNQSSDQDQVVDEEIALYSQDLKELYYGFGLHSLVVFFVFLK